MPRYANSGHAAPQFRPVNSLLGARPTIGPIPADLFIPFGGIALVMSLISSQFLGLEMEWTLALIIWGCTTWWILTGSRPYRFLSKFMPVPQRWSRSHVRYCSLQTLQSGAVAKKPRGSGRKQRAAHQSHSPVQRSRLARSRPSHWLGSGPS